MNTLRERNAGKRNYCTNGAINGKKVDNRRPKNCVNLLTCRQISYERTNGPFKETNVNRSEDG